jgi:outer membrane protein assembly factor BamB
MNPTTMNRPEPRVGRPDVLSQGSVTRPGGKVRVGRALLAGALVLGGSGETGMAMEWANYRGPEGNGICQERLREDWPAAGLPVVWKTSMTSGFSTFTVSGGMAFTQVKRTLSGVAREVCLGLDANTGQEKWATPVDKAKYDGGGDDGTSTNRGGDGPRSSPVVKNGRVYVLSSYLVLFCLNADNGTVVWSRDLVADYGGSVISWQSSASPVIEGDLLFVNCNAPDKSLLAVRISDGTEVWRTGTAGSYKMTHATPVVATIAGERQVVFFTQSGLVGAALADGKVLWKYSFPYSTSAGASPVVAGDIIYCSAGYSKGAAAIQLGRTGSTYTVKQLWRKAGELENQWSTPVHYNGYLYGLYGHGEYGSAPLMCVELATGNEMWAEYYFGPGGLVLMGDKLIVLNDLGELVFVEARPDQYTELARFPAVTGKCWNVPAVSDGRVYVRSTKQGAAFDAALPLPPARRLRGAELAAGGTLRLQVVNQDGSAVDADRLSRIGLVEAPDPTLPLAEWKEVSGLTPDGTGWLTVPQAAGVATRYFRVRENP